MLNFFGQLSLKNLPSPFSYQYGIRFLHTQDVKFLLSSGANLNIYIVLLEWDLFELTQTDFVSVLFCCNMEDSLPVHVVSTNHWQYNTSLQPFPPPPVSIKMLKNGNTPALNSNQLSRILKFFWPKFKILIFSRYCVMGASSRPADGYFPTIALFSLRRRQSGSPFRASVGNTATRSPENGGPKTKWIPGMEPPPGIRIQGDGDKVLGLPLEVDESGIYGEIVL